MSSVECRANREKCELHWNLRCGETKLVRPFFSACIRLQHAHSYAAQQRCPIGFRYYEIQNEIDSRLILLNFSLFFFPFRKQRKKIVPGFREVIGVVCSVRLCVHAGQNV